MRSLISAWQSPVSRMKLVAGLLLLLAALLYIVATRFETVHPAWGYVASFAEAAMVGAIADWFAVTALFRHPLGLPIPHTAIIPRSKARIGLTCRASSPPTSLPRRWYWPSCRSWTSPARWPAGCAIHAMPKRSAAGSRGRAFRHRRAA